MNECKVFVPYGSVGMIIPQDAFDRGLALKPDCIATDAGSTDSGPYYLGKGVCKYSEGAIKRCVRQLVVGADKISVPLLIGSCGTSGTDSGVDHMEKLIKEICAEEGITGKKIVKIYTEQSASLLAERFAEGKIHPLKNAPAITRDTFAECSHIVALGGAEPFIKALQEGADIVICGRCTDTAIISAMPLMRGCNPGAAWHGAKTAECGAGCTNKWGGTGVVLTVDETGFTIEASAEDAACSPYSVSAHMLYENSNPFVLYEPGVKLDVTKATYTQLEGGRVRVEGSQVIPMPYTMKLEGSGPVGYQTIAIVGVRDRQVLEDPIGWIDALSKNTQRKLDAFGFDKAEYSYDLRAFGYNAVSDETIEPGSYVPREVGIMLVVTATTQTLATEIAKSFNPELLHFNLHSGEMPTFAFPFSPNEIEKGLLYEFKLNHVVDTQSPDELVRYSSSTT